MNINEIKSQFQFLGSNILNISVKNDFIALPDFDVLKLKMDTEYEIKNVICKEERYATVVLTVLVSAIHKNKQKIKISITVAGYFSDSSAVGEKQFNEMLALNGCATLYAIVRAQIISLSSQALSGGQLILPMVNFFKAKQIKESEQNK